MFYNSGETNKRRKKEGNRGKRKEGGEGGTGWNQEGNERGKDTSKRADP